MAESEITDGRDDRQVEHVDADADLPELTEEEAREVTSEPVELENGEVTRVVQQNVGADRSIGGGEFPDPDAEPQEPAPGA